MNKEEGKITIRLERDFGPQAMFTWSWLEVFPGVDLVGVSQGGHAAPQPARYAPLKLTS